MHSHYESSFNVDDCRFGFEVQEYQMQQRDRRFFTTMDFKKTHRDRKEMMKEVLQ